MKKVVMIFTVMMFLFGVASADIVLQEQPKDLYNMGDVLDLPVKVTTLADINSFFIATLICNGIETEMHREYVVLSAGEERSIQSSMPLKKSFVQRKGNCKVKMYVGTETLLTEEFRISDLIVVSADASKKTFNPGDSIIIEGEAKQENGEYVEGFIDVEITIGNASSTLHVSDTVKKGYFYLNTILPEDIKAGEYVVLLNVYEKEDSANITNRGSLEYNININQVPKEVVVQFDTQEVEPGTELVVRALLNDQSGENIPTTAIISIKNSRNKVMFQQEVNTGEDVKYAIDYDEYAANWTVVAVSNKMTATSYFNIIEKSAINTEIINGTLIITNMGNIPYNESVLVKIGNETMELNTSLGVGKSVEYLLTAPDGEYGIEISANGENQVIEGVLLTGNAINIQQAGGAVYLLTHPISLIFIVLVIAGFVYYLRKKGLTKIILGKLPRRKAKNLVKPEAVKDSKSLFNIHNRADMSLSIQGTKHKSVLMTLHIKNLKEFHNRSKKLVPAEGSAVGEIQKAIRMAELHKAFIYENDENLFFIFTPLITKTFDNLDTALEVALELEKSLDKYNRLAKQKIDFGIALKEGEIVDKKEGDKIIFMGIGDIMTSSRKVANLAKDKILLSKDASDKLARKIKTEKEIHGKTVAYKISEVKHYRDSKKFIQNFVKNFEKDKD